MKLGTMHCTQLFSFSSQMVNTLMSYCCERQLTVFSISECLLNLPAHFLQLVILPLQLAHLTLDQLGIAETTLLLASLLQEHQQTQ